MIRISCITLVVTPQSPRRLAGAGKVALLRADRSPARLPVPYLWRGRDCAESESVERVDRRRKPIEVD